MVPVASPDTLWAKEFGPGTQYAVSTAVTIDGSGDVIVGGYFELAIDLGGGALTSAGPFVAMLGPSGGYLWSKAFATSGASGSVSFLSADATGVVAAGWFTGTIDCGGGPLSDMGSTSEMFVVRLDLAGNHVWSKSFGDGMDPVTLGAKLIDGAGGLRLAGVYSSSISFGGSVLAPAGTAKTADFVVDLDAVTGNQRWSTSWPATSNILLGVDGLSNAVIAGAYQNTVDFGTNALTAVGGYDLAVAKLDPNGNLLWAKSFGGTGDDTVGALAVDSAGDIVIDAFPGAAINFGGGSLPGGSSALVKLDSGGNYLWGKSFGGSAVIESMVADGTNIVAAGLAEGTITLGNGQLTSAGSGTPICS